MVLIIELLFVGVVGSVGLIFDVGFDIEKNGVVIEDRILG